jgi:hypothetical protein
MNLLFVVGTVFVTLKLTDTVQWGWGYILLPFGISIVGGLVLGVVEGFKRADEKGRR